MKGLFNNFFVKQPKKEQNTQRDDEKDPVVEFIFKKLYAPAVDFAKPFSANIKENIKFYKGDQWIRRVPSYKSKTTINYVSEVIRSEVAILTDSTPSSNVRGVSGDTDEDKAMIIKKLIDHIHYTNKWTTLFHKWVKQADIQGTAYIRPIWEEHKDSSNFNDITLLLEFPWQKDVGGVIRDPSGEDNFFIIEKKISLAEIYRLWPDKADNVKADLKDRTEISSDKEKVPTLPIQSTGGSQTVVYDKYQPTIAEQYTKVDFHIAWLRDDSVKEINKDADQTKMPKEMVPEALYPHGKFVFIANRKIELETRKCEVQHFPIVPLILDPDPQTDIFGISTIDYIKQPQIYYNEGHSLIWDWLKSVTIPRTTVDPRSGVDMKKIKNRPSASIYARPDQVRQETPPQLPNDCFRFISDAQKNIEYVSGIQDVTQGRRPENVQSAEGIKLLQEASRTVIRPKARACEEATRNLDILLIDYIQAGYSTAQIGRVIGLDGNAQEISINQPNIQGDVESLKNDITIGQYDVYVEPDSTLPKSEIERLERLERMAKDGFVDRKAILQNSGFDDWQEIEQRMQAKEDALKQQQADAAKAQQEKPPSISISINFKDLPEDGKVQVAQMIGIQIQPTGHDAQVQELDKAHKVAQIAQTVQQAQPQIPVPNAQNG